MNTIFTLWIIAIIVLAFVNIKYGLSLYLIYFFLVPFMKLQLGPISLQWNIVNIILLFAFLIRTKKVLKVLFKKSTYRFLFPFFLYFAYFLLVIPFASKLSFGMQFGYWKGAVIWDLLIPVIIVCLAKVQIKCVKIFRVAMIFSIVMACIYGLILTQMQGINPYLMVVLPLNDVEFNESYALALGDGRLFGRISSFFGHPMAFAAFLGFSAIYVYYIRKFINKYFYYFIMGLLFVNMLTCGVRTVIAGLLCAVFYYLIKRRLIKQTVYIILSSFGLLLLLVIILPDVSNYLMSIVDVNGTHSEVKGSSLDMRLNQFSACTGEISSNPLFGNGFNWNAYYMSKYGDHPILLAFESIIFVILCNHGFAGVLFYMFFIVAVIYNYKHVKLKDYPAFISMFIFYLVFITLTGENNTEYLRFYLMFASLLYIESCYAKRVSHHKRLLFIKHRVDKKRINSESVAASNHKDNFQNKI